MRRTWRCCQCIHYFLDQINFLVNLQYIWLIQVNMGAKLSGFKLWFRCIGQTKSIYSLYSWLDILLSALKQVIFADTLWRIWWRAVLFCSTMGLYKTCEIKEKCVFATFETANFDMQMFSSLKKAFDNWYGSIICRALQICSIICSNISWQSIRHRLTVCYVTKFCKTFLLTLNGRYTHIF